MILAFLYGMSFILLPFFALWVAMTLKEMRKMLEAVMQGRRDDHDVFLKEVQLLRSKHFMDHDYIIRELNKKASILKRKPGRPPQKKDK